jgi:Sulfocyanin (SoxE) domain
MSWSPGRLSVVASAVMEHPRSAMLRRTTAAAGALLLLAAGPPAFAHDERPSGKPDPHRFLSWDASRRVAHLTLVAGFDGGNNGFNFDGYGRGELLVTIPLGWRVVVDCENHGGARHSCAVVRGSLSILPAFPGAASPAPIIGLPPGSKATFSFRATRTGSFRIACLVPGHAQARQWDVLDIVRGGRPSISARPGP